MQYSNDKEAGVKDPLRQGILFSLFYLEQGKKVQSEETVYSVKKTSYKQLLSKVVNGRCHSLMASELDSGSSRQVCTLGAIRQLF